MLLVPSGCQKRSSPKLFILRDHGPQHTGHFVSQCDCRKHPWLAGEDAPQPGALCWRSSSGSRNYRHRAYDQQASDITLPGFARAPEPLLAAARMLPRRETQPCREVAPSAEILRRGREGGQSHRGDGTNAWHLLQTRRKPRALAGGRDPCVEFRYPI